MATHPTGRNHNATRYRCVLYLPRGVRLHAMHSSMGDARRWAESIPGSIRLHARDYRGRAAGWWLKSRKGWVRAKDNQVAAIFDPVYEETARSF